MSQWVKALVAQPDDLSLIPRNHTEEKKNNRLKKASDFYMHVMACQHPPTYIQYRTQDK